MSLSGTRGLVRISRNPDCQFQAAMVFDRVREPEFYRRLTGTDFPGEYGERIAARRRGTRFEANLTQNNSALLRRTLAPRFDFDPEEMEVRNFAEEAPGPRMRAVRWSRTRNVMRDLAAGKPVPQLLVQPQFRLITGPGPKDYEYVSPDFAVLDPRVSIYVPGEMKSFIVRDNVADRADLELPRRQAAAQIVSLRGEARRHGIGDRVDNWALFIFALPYGLRPAQPVEERLDAEVREIERAVATLAAVRIRVQAQRARDDARLEDMFQDLPRNYQDSCIGSCILAGICQRDFAGKARRLGDRASGLLGPDMPIGRVIELVNGAAPKNRRERDLVPELLLAANAIGYRPRRVRSA